jgi:hypothetical protein
VGTEIHERTHGGWDSHIIEFFAVGTAVAAISAEHRVPPPTLVLTVNE